MKHKHIIPVFVVIIILIATSATGITGQQAWNDGATEQLGQKFLAEQELGSLAIQGNNIAIIWYKPKLYHNWYICTRYTSVVVFSLLHRHTSDHK